MRAKILKIYGYILMIAGIYFIWIKLTGITIPCTVYSTTGFLCPGCGITRMFTSMAELKFNEAFRYNPVIFILLFIWIGISAGCMLKKPVFLKNRIFLYSALGLSVFLMVIYGIFRNIY